MSLLIITNCLHDSRRQIRQNRQNAIHSGGFVVFLSLMHTLKIPRYLVLRALSLVYTPPAHRRCAGGVYKLKSGRDLSRPLIRQIGSDDQEIATASLLGSRLRPFQVRCRFLVRHPEGVPPGFLDVPLGVRGSLFLESLGKCLLL